MKLEDESTVETAEMKYMRRSEKYAWEDFNMNQDILD
jgi:hypothetical protein